MTNLKIGWVMMIVLLSLLKYEEYLLLLLIWCILAPELSVSTLC